MSNNINIQVLGSGCPTCKKLYEMTKEVVAEMSIATEVEYVTDIQKIVSMGVMQSPVLAMNGEALLTGGAFDKEKIQNAIKKGRAEKDEQTAVAKSGGCGCGGSC